MTALVLHHNGLSSCSQKVRLVLAEKGLAWESREVNLVTGEQHAPEYVKLNPSHVVPTLVHDGRVLIEFSLIDQYLDEVFPAPPLVPRDPAGRHAMRVSFDPEAFDVNAINGAFGGGWEPSRPSG